MAQSDSVTYDGKNDEEVEALCEQDNVSFSDGVFQRGLMTISISDEFRRDSRINQVTITRTGRGHYVVRAVLHSHSKGRNPHLPFESESTLTQQICMWENIPRV